MLESCLKVDLLRRYGALQEVEQAIQKKLRELPKDRLLIEEVGPDDVAAVVGRWTGIPVDKIRRGERERLLRLKEELHKRVVGTPTIDLMSKLESEVSTTLPHPTELDQLTCGMVEYRSGRGSHGCGRCCAAQPSRTCIACSGQQLHVPGPHRCWEDGACQGLGRVALR